MPSASTRARASENASVPFTRKRTLFLPTSIDNALVILPDASAFLAAALREQWPTLAIQRCTAHKLRNLEAKAPMRLREELAEDCRRMIYADSRAAV